MTACPTCGFQNAGSARFCAECGQKLGSTAASGDVRRTVSVLFADVSGSTALGEQLDPESVRTLMGRYFSAMKEVIERHGGTVEKFIGDAVMAVFGIPTLHEDDALRAVKAAADIRETLEGLNADLRQSRGLAILFRTGVNTGEVVAGDPSAGQTLVTGDTVNTAARLEQAARPGEILLGPTTHGLVRDAVVVEPTEPIAAKGKAQPVQAYRLVSVTQGVPGHARRLDAPMVGRAGELGALIDAFERSVAARTTQLVTVLGTAGVGKSRLIQEFRQKVDGRATFLIGHCLSYGDGITYWPLTDALRGLVAVDEHDLVGSWHAGLMAVLAGEPRADAIVEQVVGLIGAGEAASGSDASWAVRRLLEQVARHEPLVFVIDDLHWATPTFLDLIEHLAGWTRDAPILFVCVARAELLDARPGWGGGRLNATTVHLEPLDAASINQLLTHLLGAALIGTELPGRIAAAAEGNPLFIEELVAMLVERGVLVGDGRSAPSSVPPQLDVPGTIEALVAARLDQLPAEERAILGRGSVVGREFGAGEVAYLSERTGSASVWGSLMAMVRRDLLRPDPEALLPMGDEDEGFEFRHQLIRDGAYGGMSKAERARLHHRYATLLENLPAERLLQLDEVAGYHLEQAYLLWNSLGEERNAPDTASGAASHLSSAGVRAHDRGDFPAAVNLLGRAAALLPPADPQRVAFLWDLAGALTGLGRFEEGAAARREVIKATEDGSNPTARVAALLGREELARLKGASEGERTGDIEEARAIAEATGDLGQLAMVHLHVAMLAADAGRLGEARRELELALDAAQRSGDISREANARWGLGQFIWYGMSASSDIDRFLADSLAFAREHGRRYMEAKTLRAQAVEAARRGQIADAHRLMAECLAILTDLGASLEMAGSSLARGDIESLTGEPVARERVLREGYETLNAMGERGVLSTVAADLADALLDLGRVDESAAMCDVAEQAGPEDDVVTQVRVQLVRGRLVAARHSIDEGLTSVADAVALADQGEFYDLRTLSRLVFAQLLLDAGRIDQARRRAQEVVDLARVRGDVVLASRANNLLEGTSVSSPKPSRSA